MRKNLFPTVLQKIAFLFFLFPFMGNTYAQQNDAVLKILKSELDRNYSILSKENIPAYYISAQLTESYAWSCSGRLGFLQTPIIEPMGGLYLSAMLRVGNYELDNSHEIKDADYGFSSIATESVGLENNERIFKTTLWSQIDALYKSAVLNYNQIKVDISLKKEQEEKINDFSKEKVDTYYEKPVSVKDFAVDTAKLQNKVKLYSAVFNKNKDVFEGSAIFYFSYDRKWFIDSEGREIVQNQLSGNLSLTANAIADDGMALSLYKDWTFHTLDEMPTDEEVLKEAELLSQNMTALKKAPVVESFTGPAILSPEAAGVFFHEIFGHRIEGARMRQERDAQTFKKKIGEKVLPDNISVTFDPTVNVYKNMKLHGNYAYDEEGIKSQKVEVVKNGTLTAFLMSRKPIPGISNSNGHGRAQLGMQPVSRQSNMIVESTQKYSFAELKKMLIEEAKKQGKDYAYYFKEVSGGYTYTERYAPNAFNITPLMVYKIYVDGRPDELVRGVDLVGTPLSMFSQIEACGNEYAAFNGTCGAESGGVPVSCVAPGLFVKKIETQKSVNEQIEAPILAKP